MDPAARATTTFGRSSGRPLRVIEERAVIEEATDPAAYGATFPVNESGDHLNRLVDGEQSNDDSALKCSKVMAGRAGLKEY